MGKGFDSYSSPQAPYDAVAFNSPGYGRADVVAPKWLSSNVRHQDPFFGATHTHPAVKWLDDAVMHLYRLNCGTLPMHQFGLHFGSPVWRRIRERTKRSAGTTSENGLKMEYTPFTCATLEVNPIQIHCPANCRVIADGLRWAIGANQRGREPPTVARVGAHRQGTSQRARLSGDLPRINIQYPSPEH